MSQEGDPLMIERALLGCVIRQRDTMDALPPLHPNEFIDAQHAAIWTTITKEASGGLRHWDAAVLAARGGLDSQYLHDLQITAPRGKAGSGLASEYAKLIKQGAFDRKVRGTLELLMRSDASGEVLRSLIEREITNVMDADLGTDGPRLMGEALPAWFDRKNQMLNSGTDMYIQLGHPDIDARMGGLRPGELMIIAGRPATGKTQLSLQFAEYNARRGKRVHYISLEMMDEQLINRMISRQGVNAGKLRNLHQQDDPNAVLAEATEAATKISQLPIWADYSSDNLGAITAHARRMKRREKTDLIIVDYLQLVGDDDGRSQSNRTQEVARISRGLKRLAIQLQVPIIALAQLNRELERDGNRRPQLSDLREAGSIEQDADFVLFLWRHAMSFPQDGIPNTDATNIVEMILSKGREVQPGIDYLRAEFQYARFRDVSQIERELYRNLINPAKVVPMSRAGGAFGATA